MLAEQVRNVLTTPEHVLGVGSRLNCTRPCRPQALILSPTRELAVQTQKNIQIIGENLKVVPHACIGGKSIGDFFHPPTSSHALKHDIFTVVIHTQL